MSGKDKLIIKRSNGHIGNKDNNIEESKHVMEHTPILHIYHLNGRTQIFKFGTRVLLTREEDGAIVAWVLVMQKKRVINNMTKLKLDQHHLKIQY
jgi:hypothetical protein